VHGRSANVKLPQFAIFDGGRACCSESSVSTLKPSDRPVTMGPPTTMMYTFDFALAQISAQVLSVFVLQVWQSNDLGVSWTRTQANGATGTWTQRGLPGVSVFCLFFSSQAPLSPLSCSALPSTTRFSSSDQESLLQLTCEMILPSSFSQPAQ